VKIESKKTGQGRWLSAGLVDTTKVIDEGRPLKDTVEVAQIKSAAWSVRQLDGGSEKVLGGCSDRGHSSSGTRAGRTSPSCGGLHADLGMIGRRASGAGNEKKVPVRGPGENSL